MSKLMGKARDIIKVTLRSNPSLKPRENSKDTPCSLTTYVSFNRSVPILKLFREDGDLRPNFRLARETLHVVFDMLPWEKLHGWGHELEI
ncbi:hypothetical protein AAFF_G00329740 [Aldrovandia affinis]|uniref:Uncharacterized protein n=1 Tax=Aldrovandia affinis TaxID=143900 RepID=A0AAD7SM59_9TELE|nr:hypothetical protein AAFF_G00329740 [Aldrovandia affinis]